LKHPETAAFDLPNVLTWFPLLGDAWLQEQLMGHDCHCLLSSKEGASTLPVFYEMLNESAV
jgi:hypothetical protein